MKRESPFWIHSQCKGCVHVQVDKKAGCISCPYYRDGISLKVERWDILCGHRMLPGGNENWIDDTILFALEEKLGEEAKRLRRRR